MKAFLILMCITLAIILHVLDCYRNYRNGYEEGYDTGYDAGRKDRVTE